MNIKTDKSSFFKEINYSIFKDGFAINQKYHDIVHKFTGQSLEKGYIQEIPIYFNGKKYSGKLVCLKNKSERPQYQIRYTDTALINSLKSVFSASYNHLRKMRDKKKIKGKKYVKNIFDEYIEITFDSKNLCLRFKPKTDIDLQQYYNDEIYVTEDLKTDEYIIDLENKTPEKVKKTIEKYERGNISNKVKKDAGYKCQICEALGIDPLGFKKRNSDERYIEAHHVTPVSRQEKGSLHPRNLICVCANHHRQIHYGNVKLLNATDKYFEYDFEGQIIRLTRHLNWKL